jgi:putative flippase GtrA
MSSSKKTIIQFVQYLFVGGTAFIFDFGSFYILTSVWGVYYLYSATISFVIGLNVNYFLGKLFFKSSKIANVKKEYMTVAAISVSALLLKLSMLFMLTDWIGINVFISKLVTVIFLMFYNFIGRKIFVFE